MARLFERSPAHRLLPLAALLLLVALRLPTLLTPYFEDDLHQLAYLAGAEQRSFSFRGGWDLFRFLDGDAASARERIEQGVLPWRTDPAQKVAFLRPVASRLMWLDQALFGLRPLPAHLHSLLWFVVFALSVERLYAGLLPRRAALVALLACLLTPTSLQPLRWWSARNALLATLFAAWCLHFYLAWWRSGRPGRLVAALGALLVALLSAESALAILAFPVAHAAVEGRAAPKRAIVGVASLLLLGIVHLLVRGALGYGVAGSALYVDPLAEPLAYATTALPRLPAALSIVFLNEVSRSPAIVLPLLLALAVLIGARLRSGGEARRLSAWLTAGAGLALCVCFASRSSLRPWTLLIPQLGAHAVLGLALAGPWTARRSGEPAAAARPLTARALAGKATALLAAGLAVAVLLVPLERHWAMAALSTRTDSARQRAAELPRATRRALDTSTRLVVLVSSPYQIRTAGLLRVAHDLELPPGVDVLTVSDNALAGGRYSLARTGPRELRLACDQPLLRRDDLFRHDSERPLEAGGSVRGDRFAVRVDETAGDAVTAIDFGLGLDLDDPGVVLLRWDGAAFAPVEPPRIGETLRWQ
jgi:hypothetical protein